MNKFVGIMLAIGLAAVPAAGSAQAQRTPSESLVADFLDATFNRKAPEEAFAKYVGPYYRQHNPTVPDGKEAIISRLRQWLPTVPALHYQIVRMISNGDLVAVHSKVTSNPEDRGMAVVDIFRLEDGKVVEHWDVATPVPETSANTNTMF